jgi:hypothetical protein
VKLEQFRKLPPLKLSSLLKLAKHVLLKQEPDGTLMEGHHRIKVLRERGVDVDTLPREVLPKD